MFDTLVVDKVFALLATWDVVFQMTFFLTLVVLFSWFLSRCFQVLEWFGQCVVMLFWGWPSDQAPIVTCKCECHCDNSQSDGETSDEADADTDAQSC